MNHLLDTFLLDLLEYIFEISLQPCLVITVRLDREISQAVALLRTIASSKSKNPDFSYKTYSSPPFWSPQNQGHNFTGSFSLKVKKETIQGSRGGVVVAVVVVVAFIVLRKSVRTENLCPLDPVDDLTLEDAGHDAEDAAGGGGVEITTPEATLRPQLRNEERDPGCRGLYYPLL